MRWKYGALVGCFLMSGTAITVAETFRLETVVYQEDQSCKYTLSRPDWKSHLNDLLRAIVDLNIQYVRLEQQGSILIQDVPDNKSMTRFKTIYRGMASDGYGGETLHEIIEIEGISFIGSKGITIKVTNSNHATKSYLSGSFITCDPVSVPNDIPLSVEDMKKMEVNALRKFEQKMGDAADDITAIGVKAAAGSLGKFAGNVVERSIDQKISESKNLRNEAFKNNNLSGIERISVDRIQRENFCNTFWSGGGGC
jgi:hypothetical protein